MGSDRSTRARARPCPAGARGPTEGAGGAKNAIAADPLIDRAAADHYSPPPWKPARDAFFEAMAHSLPVAKSTSTPTGFTLGSSVGLAPLDRRPRPP